MPETFKVELDTPIYKGSVSCNTGLFINGKFVDAVEGGTIDVINPSTGKLLTKVAAATSKDVDIAVEAAKKAYKTSWGLKVSGAQRGELLMKLATLLEANIDEFAALECLNVGKPWSESKGFDMKLTLQTLKYYAGWADKVHGKTIETNEQKLAYTRHEPYGVVGQIIPWNYPLTMVSWKIGPALATGNVVVLKPSEITPLTALKLAGLVQEAGFPPGVVNIIPGYGELHFIYVRATAGAAMSLHPDIRKIAFTGSTLTGRKIQEASAKSNLKVVTLELGGKSPNIIFNDADLEQAVKWAAIGIFSNSGQVCTAGSRIFVQEGIYDAFIKAFSEAAAGVNTKTGDPFAEGTIHGPVVSQTQFDRVMGYIDAAKAEGATAFIGGERHSLTEGFFVKPTIFTDCTPDMKIVQEEVFGPVAAVVKFKTENEVIEMANDSNYGLACAVFTENVSRAIRVSNALEAGMAWVNCNVTTEYNVPFGGYKQSGYGRELGAYAIDTYTQVKAVHINVGLRI
ncbi:aldehyde dehydrogenase [Lentinula edodes]|uniref:aldehyde dehydrogenase n=1 Tax=Lentinula edodes TaxID=5353 RepID=UPI001E8D936B|nr:aldehyde dehydrogenase [Lentinula edodes]KAH7876625.1 aldehyde dehydrogenase [Lentinula edodes]